MRRRRDWVGLGIAVVLAVAVQAVLWDVPSPGDAPMATPDTQGYVVVARVLGQGIPDEATRFRTPVYPAVLALAALGTQTDLQTTHIADTYEAPWTAVNEDSIRLAQALRAIQFLMGGLTMLLIYLTAQNAFGRSWFSLCCVLLFVRDLPTLSYQDVVLTESTSVLVTWLALCLGSVFLRTPGYATAILAGSACTLAVGTRPALIVLPMVLFLIAAQRNRVTAFGHRQDAAKSNPVGWPVLATLLMTAATLPIAWSALNYHWHGTFQFSSGAVITLPNHVAQSYLEIETSDQRHATLQRHLRPEVLNSPTHAHSRVAHNVRQELAMDRAAYEDLLQEMFWMSLNHDILPYGKSVAREFVRAWSYPFDWPHVKRLREYRSPVGFFSDRLLGGWLALPLFLLVLGGAYRMTEDPVTRDTLGYMAGFALCYTLLSAATDTCSTLRHVLASRVVINVVIAGSLYVITHAAWRSYRPNA